MNLEGKRIAVIGGAGLIGSHIVDQLVREPVAEIIVLDNFVRGTLANLASASQDARVRVVTCSMLDREALRGHLVGMDGVFLLASLWLGECLSDPKSAWDVNVMGSFNVIEACRDLGISRLVYSSSASVYGNAVIVPMTEEHPFANRTTYGATKIAVEQMLRAIHEQSGLPYVGHRYMNVYGPRMDYRGTYVSVIMKVLDKVFANEQPVIFGDGTQTYDFVYVEDVAQANVLSMKADCRDELFNVGSGIGTTLNELVSTLLALCNSDLTPRYEPAALSIVTHRIGSTEKAERLLGFRARTSLHEGLARVVAWRKAMVTS